MGTTGSMSPAKQRALADLAARQEAERKRIEAEADQAELEKEPLSVADAITQLHAAERAERTMPTGSAHIHAALTAAVYALAGHVGALDTTDENENQSTKETK